MPRSTLGCVVPGSTSGPPKYLSTQEEELVQFLIDCASIGYPCGHLKVIAMVQCVCHERGIERVVTHGWCESFCCCHPDVTLRVTAPLSLSRAKSTDVNVINKTSICFRLQWKSMIYFRSLVICLTLMKLDYHIMVCCTGPKNPCCINSGGKSEITVVGYISATGYCVPPRKLYFASAEMVQGEIPGTAYGFSSKGWRPRFIWSFV